MINPVRGTVDLYGDQARKYRAFIAQAMEILEVYNYEEMSTPIFEFAHVFDRTIGEVSDIVSKEMYLFPDRSGELLALRPEGTASVVRAFISNGLEQTLPQKLWYAGPMFRYERPQRGRYRQFHQLGVELLGAEHALADVEVIMLAQDLLCKMGLSAKVELHVNSLGDFSSRQAYIDALKKYFWGYREKLSKNSQERLEKNPLRILDSKDEEDQPYIVNAPLGTDFVTESSKLFFSEVLSYLEELGVKYTLNPRLVRGLDYYCHTTFEFIHPALGAQNAVIAGGRYDGLVKKMGGRDIPGVGWAAGIERLLLSAELELDKKRAIAVVPMDNPGFQASIKLVQRLREAGIKTLFDYSGNAIKRLKKANRAEARFAVLLGEREILNQQFVVKDLDSGAQETIACAQLERYLLEKCA